MKCPYCQAEIYAIPTLSRGNVYCDSDRARFYVPDMMAHHEGIIGEEKPFMLVSGEIGVGIEVDHMRGDTVLGYHPHCC